MANYLLTLAGISGFTGVALGAFGAHGLKGQISPALMEAYQTAVQYQLIHTLAVVAVVMLGLRYAAVPAWHWAGMMFLAGILLFSGSLYVLALGGSKLFGPITPLGGLCFLAGWACFAWAAWQSSAHV